MIENRLMWYGPYGGMMSWGGGWGFLMMLVPLILIILLVVWLGSLFTGGSLWRHDPRRIDRRTAGLEILEERYARGEIQRDEYLQKKNDLAA